MEWAVGLGLLAVLFNPFVVVGLDRAVWAGLDVAAAVALAASASKVGTLLESEPDETLENLGQS